MSILRRCDAGVSGGAKLRQALIVRGGSGTKSLREGLSLWLDSSGLNSSSFENREKAHSGGASQDCGSAESGRVRLHVYYSGHVQGVGFRYTAKGVAAGFDVVGLVRNLHDGRVELIAEGRKAELEEFRQAIRDAGMGPLIRREDVTWGEAQGVFRGFEIG